MYKTSGLIQEYYLVLGKKIKLGTQTTVFVSTLCKTLLSLYRANKQAKYYLRAVKSQLTCLTQGPRTSSVCRDSAADTNHMQPLWSARLRENEVELGHFWCSPAHRLTCLYVRARISQFLYFGLEFGIPNYVSLKGVLVLYLAGKPSPLSAFAVFRFNKCFVSAALSSFPLAKIMRKRKRQKENHNWRGVLCIPYILC